MFNEEKVKKWALMAAKATTTSTKLQLVNLAKKERFFHPRNWFQMMKPHMWSFLPKKG